MIEMETFRKWIMDISVKFNAESLGTSSMTIVLLLPSVIYTTPDPGLE
jgi:hypothetical protein